jgi:hypothetical protein
VVVKGLPSSPDQGYGMVLRESHGEESIRLLLAAIGLFPDTYASFSLIRIAKLYKRRWINSIPLVAWRGLTSPGALRHSNNTWMIWVVRTSKTL